MASQTLETVISINARVGKGFSQVGSTLTELGSIVNGASQELITFGKDSTKVYRDYEKSMKDAEVALSTQYGRGTRELKQVMSNLNVSATEWAATTIFHTNDVANALSEAAHAGWDYEQIMAGMPAAMQLAQAGGLDLSEAVDYIVKSTNAAGVEFKDLGSFVDLWTFAANSSASTIGEFGDAMLRMGSTMRFAGDTKELMTLIAVTANAGATGSEAGTMIRNSMMRLIAPTDKAKKAMAQLGATSTETASIMGDEALATANAELAAHGFSAFYQDGPQKGQMKSVLNTYRELYVALGDIAGGYNNISRNEDALEVLSAIFPTRTITEALTLIRGAAEGYDGLYEAMNEGAAEGYGAYAAQTQMDTLYGSMETFESKVERLKQVVGEHLAGQIESATGPLGTIVDQIASMDADKLGSLINGLEVIAAAGPGLLLAGGAFRLIGLAFTPAGGITLGAIALATLATTIKQLEDSKFADNFGNMDLDTEAIKGYIDGIGQGFRDAYADVDAFKGALDEAVESYETASSTFSSKLLEKMLTGSKLTDADITQLQSLGEEMYNSVISGITNRTAASMTYWEIFFGGTGTAENDPTYRKILGLTDAEYQSALGEVEQIGIDMRNAMSKAFEDGEISEEEYQQILSYMQSYNAAMARAAAEAQEIENQVELRKMLHRAQTASWEDIKEISETISSNRNKAISDEEDRFLDEYYRLEVTGKLDAETSARLKAVHEQKLAQITADYDEPMLALWDSQIKQSGQGENYDALAGIALQYMGGTITGDDANKIIRDMMGKSAYAGDTGWGNLTKTDRAQLGKMLGFMVGGLGGTEGVSERIDYYNSIGETDLARRLSQLMVMEQLVNNFGEGTVLDKPVWDILNITEDYTNSNIRSGGTGDLPYQINKDKTDSLFWASQFDAGNARSIVANTGGGLIGYFSAIGQSNRNGSYEPLIRANKLSGNEKSVYKSLIDAFAQNYDLDKILAESDSFLAGNDTYKYGYAAWKLMYGMTQSEAEKYRIQVPVDPVFTEDAVVPIRPKVEGEDSMTALQQQGVTVDVGADDTQLQATIDGADGQTLIEYLDGDNTGLSMKITDQDGKLLTEIVDGNTAALAAAIAKYNGMTIHVNIVGNHLFAEGGRATSASIFGEAGPEWAIPEEHSERTANLLNAARAASGFTWPDILGRFGGLNADANHSSPTIIYSPTINAADASGVDQVLREDKKRLDKWYEKLKMHEDLEVYA